MLFTKACRVTAILIVVLSVLTIAANVFRMFGIDEDAARSVFLQKIINKNGPPLILGIALGTLADISRALQSKATPSE
ncbi:hypothetical protein [Albidovulum sp.]